MAYFKTNVLDNQIKALPTIATASGSIATFTTDKAENLVECVCEVASGKSEVNVIACGKNLLDCASHINATSSNLTISASLDGSISYNGMPSNSWAFLSTSFNYYLPSGTTVTFSRQQAFAYRHYLQITFADNSSDTLIIENNTTSVTKTFTKSIIKLQLIVSGLSTSSTYNDNVKLMLNIGASALPYEPYNGTKLNIPLGETLSGNGSFDVLSGILTRSDDTTKQLSANYIQANNGINNVYCDTGDISVQFILSVGSYVNQNV